MFLFFKVSNFLSIRDTVEINLLASSDKSLEANLHTPPLNKVGAKQQKLRVLKSAIIYGANASGKTNTILALRRMANFVITNLEKSEKRQTPFDCFLLAPENKTKPTELEISYLHDGVLYRYGFSADKTSIHEEWLFMADKGREKEIFTRELNPETKKFTYTGDRTFTSIAQNTKSNSLLLSVASNNYNITIAKTLLTAFEQIVAIEYGAYPIPSEKYLPLLKEILSFADTGICDLCIKKLPPPPNIAEFFAGITSSAEISDERRTELQNHFREQIENRKTLSFMYTNSQGKEVALPSALQSSGTHAFISAVSALLNSCNTGGLLLCDEIERSLHPTLLEAFFKIYHSLPCSNVQLICTTHDALLLKSDIFRRDQVFLTEKDATGNTTLSSLADFKGIRKEYNLGKNYLEGTFGGLPIFDESALERFIKVFHSVIEKKHG